MKRRDITFGMVQDECVSRDGQCSVGGKDKCKFESVCPFHLGTRPINIDLTDPPRFTDAQMALLKALYGIGVNKIQSGAAFDGIYLYTKDLINTAGLIYSGKIGTSIKLEDGETLDLAELLGKDAT